MKTQIILLSFFFLFSSCNNLPKNNQLEDTLNQELPSHDEKKISNKFIGQTYSLRSNDSFGQQTETFSFHKNGKGHFVVGWTVYRKDYEDKGNLTWKINNGEIQVYYTYHASDGVVTTEEAIFEYDEEKNQLVSTEYDSEIYSCVSSNNDIEYVEPKADNENDEFESDGPTVSLEDSPEEYFGEMWREAERHYISNDKSAMYQISTDIENEDNVIIDYSAFGEDWTSGSKKCIKKGKIISIKVDNLNFTEYWDSRLEVKDHTTGEILTFDVWYRSGDSNWRRGGK